jgi:hypothetical protein
MLARLTAAVFDLFRRALASRNMFASLLPCLISLSSSWNYCRTNLQTVCKRAGESGLPLNNLFLSYNGLLVGAPRFELGTPSPPDWII